MIQKISKGTVPNDGTGTQAPEAADIINGNFAEQQNALNALSGRIGSIAGALDEASELARTGSPKRMKIVAASDFQPVNSAQRAVAQALMAHIAKRHKDADWIIADGDITHRGNNPGDWKTPPEGWPTSTAWWPNEPILQDKLVEDMRVLGPRHRQLMNAGNHCIGYGTAYSPSEFTYANYKKWFGKLFYHVVIGNICLVFMGPMARATAGNIPDFVVDWWKSLTSSRMFGSVITVTHQPLQNTTAGSSTGGGSLVESFRFTDALAAGDCKTDVWLSGHTGSDLNNPAVVDHGDFFGTHCVALDMNSGIDDEGQPTNAGLGTSYVVVEFEAGSKSIRFTRWNVTTNSISKTWTVEVDNPIELSAEPVFDGRFQVDDQFHVNNSATVKAVEVARQTPDGGLTYEAPNRINWIEKVILTDFGNNNVQTGSGPGTLYYIPGSALNGGAIVVSPELNRPYGVGGGWAYVKGRLTDNDYRCHAKLLVSTSGQFEDSLVEVAEVEPDKWRTKVASRFSAVFLDSWTAVAAGLTPGFQIAGNAASNSSAIMGRWSTGAGAASLVTVKSRAASPGLFATVAAGDVLFDTIFTGDNGTANVESARLRAIVDTAPAGGIVRSSLVWLGHNGSAIADRMTLKSDGGLLIHDAAGAAPTGGSKGAGTINLAGGLYIGGNVALDATGVVNLRSYTVATLPTVTPAGRLISVSDGTSNKRLAISDGTNWRFPDGAIVS